MSLWLPLEETSQVAEARRLASGAAQAAGLDANEVSGVALVVTEAARNVVKHAGSGEILVEAAAGAVTILALDRGPGMPNVEACLRDGFSTAGSPGTGLGAIHRISSEFALWSAPGSGTALYARVGRPENGTFCWASIVRPTARETVSGDAVFFRPAAGEALASVVDGLGHGPEAERAAQEAVGILDRHAGREPAALLGIAHDALHSTRGAAMAIARIDLEGRKLRYAGVGNISGGLWSEGGFRNLLSHPGTLGHEVRKIQELEYPVRDGALLVMHSDGIDTHWKLETYPGLSEAHPWLVAGILYRDHARGRDDLSVLVARERG